MVASAGDTGGTGFDADGSACSMVASIGATGAPRESGTGGKNPAACSSPSAAFFPAASGEAGL